VPLPNVEPPTRLPNSETFPNRDPVVVPVVVDREANDERVLLAESPWLALIPEMACEDEIAEDRDVMLADPRLVAVAAPEEWPPVAAAALAPRAPNELDAPPAAEAVCPAAPALPPKECQAPSALP
jgi:hypothetical protein